MPGPVFIDGDRLALRVEHRDDLDVLRDARNDPAVRRPLTMSHPENLQQAEDSFERHSDDDSGVGLLVCREPVDDGVDADPDVPDDDPRTEIVGKVVLFMIDDVAGNGEIAYWILPEYQGNGYATEAAALVVEYAFTERRLHKVNVRALAENTGSRAVIEKLGATEDGRLREEEFIAGEHKDVVKYSLLEADWAGLEAVV